MRGSRVLQRASKLILFVVIVLAACAPSSVTPSTARSVTQPSSLAVFAAASLTDVFQEISQAFEMTYPGTRVFLTLLVRSDWRFSLSKELGPISLPRPTNELWTT